MSNIEHETRGLLNSPANKVQFLTGSLITDWLFFQLCWFALILSQSDWVALGIGFACLLLANRIRKILDLSSVIFIFSLGIVFDQLMFGFAVINFSESTNSQLTSMIPLWLIALWILFSVFCQSMFHWLRNKLIFSLLLGAFAGPLTYWGAAAMGSVQILEPTLFLFFYAIFWGLLMAGLSTRFYINECSDKR